MPGVPGSMDNKIADNCSIRYAWLALLFIETVSAEPTLTSPGPDHFRAIGALLVFSALIHLRLGFTCLVNLLFRFLLAFILILQAA